MFSNAKIGDKVYDMRYGWCTISEIDKKSRYPIETLQKGIIRTYTIDGCHSQDSINPVLYQDEPKPVISNEPILNSKPDIDISVKNNAKENKTISASASDLVKKSAKQLVYLKYRQLHYNEKPNPTSAQKIGVEKQLQRSTSQYLEMRGINYITSDKTIFFSFDEVISKKKKTIFIEHKNIDDMKTLEQWYIDYSIFQVAFYAALAEQVNSYQTASFFTKQGYEKKELYVSNKKVFHLYFKSESETLAYKVKVLEPSKILAFYTKKMNCLDFSLKSDMNKVYDKATLFDSKYKREEIKLLSKYYKIKELK